jgi:hypothetical protein
MNDDGGAKVIFQPPERQNEKLPCNWFESLPDDRMKRLWFEGWLEYELKKRFKDWLTRNRRPVTKEPEKQRDNFDEFLIDQAKELGPRVFCCDTVRRRIVYWNDHHPDGLGRTERFYAALQRHVEVGRGDATGSINDPNEYSLKVHLKRELKALQGRLRVPKANRHNLPSWDDVQGEVIDNASAYPRIFENLLSLEQFCKTHPEVFRSFTSGSETVAEFLNQWHAWPKRLDPEYVRQATSKLGSRKRGA